MSGTIGAGRASQNLSSSPAVALPMTEEGAAGAAGEARRPDALPCQESDNCIDKNSDRKPAPLSPYRLKCRHRLVMAVEWMVQKYGFNHVGLLTLSFGVTGSGRGSKETYELREQAKDLDFVQARWHSFSTNVISRRYDDWICILEPHKDGVWHIHVVVVCKNDIRAGTNVETLTDYNLPYWMRRGKHLRNEALAVEWQALRQACCKYRFGRVELMPIKKTKEAFARYLAKYLTKSFNLIPAGQKRRLIRFSRGVSFRITMRFSVLNLSNLIYRTRLKLAASMLHFRDYGDFADYFGSRWNYYTGDIIASIPIPMIFAKTDFGTGLAAKILNLYCDDPFLFLGEKEKKKMMSAHSALLNKFTELAFDDGAETRWQKSEQNNTDHLDIGRLTNADQQEDWLEMSDNPF